MPAPLPDWFVDLANELRQWGRWGDDDQIGMEEPADPDQGDDN